MQANNHILIAEDDLDDRNFITKAFEENGKRESINFFSCGPTLLKHLDTLLPDHTPPLIVLDYRMPLLNGLETLQNIRKHPVHSQVPVVVFSSFLFPEIEQQLKNLDILCYLKKGTNFQKLIEQVRFFTELISDDVETLLGI